MPCSEQLSVVSHTKMKRPATARQLSVCLPLFSAVLVFAAKPGPFLSQPSKPASVTVGAPGVTLTLRGAGFMKPGSVVHWNRQTLQTTVLSATKLTAKVPASLLSKQHTGVLTVVNPAPGGGASQPYSFTVSPAPHQFYKFTETGLEC
jgi:hypothetical protein